MAIITDILLEKKARSLEGSLKVLSLHIIVAMQKRTLRLVSPGVRTDLTISQELPVEKDAMRVGEVTHGLKVQARGISTVGRLSMTAETRGGQDYIVSQ